MKNKVLIAGTGQLGSRYLQGLFNTNFDIEIWAYDISEESLNRAKILFNETGISQNKVYYITNLIYCQVLDNRFSINNSG
jgi:prephenate dehydrogenase